MKSNCTHLYLLSTLACQLTECFNEQELEELSVDLTALGALIESALVCRPACKASCSVLPDAGNEQ